MLTGKEGERMLTGKEGVRALTGEERRHALTGKGRRRAREWALFIVAQAAVFVALRCAHQPRGALLAAAVITAAGALLVATDGSFPDFAVRHFLPVSALLALTAAAPLLYCLSGGEGVTPLYDTELTHNNLVSILTNSCAWLIVVCALTLMRRHADIRRFAREGFAHQGLFQALFLDVCLACVLTYIRMAEQNHATIDAHTHIHNTLTSVFLLMLYFCFLTLAYCTAAFFFNYRSGAVRVFSRRDMLLLEPCVAVLLLLGVVTRPEEPNFLLFIVFCPAVIVIYTTMISFFGAETENIFRSRRFPMSFRTLMGFVNLTAYAAIIAAHYHNLQLILPFGALGVWFILTVFSGSLTRWRAARRDMLAIRALSAFPRDPHWYEEKRRVYHRMRVER